MDSVSQKVQGEWHEQISDYFESSDLIDRRLSECQLDGETKTKKRVRGSNENVLSSTWLQVSIRKSTEVENAMGERQELNKITKLFLVNSTISLNSTLNHVALLEILSVSLNLVGSSTFLHFLSHESSPHRVSLSLSFSRYRERLGDDWKVWKHSNTPREAKKSTSWAEWRAESIATRSQQSVNCKISQVELLFVSLWFSLGRLWLSSFEFYSLAAA